jgi:hypothetical protein
VSKEAVDIVESTNQCIGQGLEGVQEEGSGSQKERYEWSDSC